MTGFAENDLTARSEIDPLISTLQLATKPRVLIRSYCRGTDSLMLPLILVYLASS